MPAQLAPTPAVPAFKVRTDSVGPTAAALPGKVVKPVAMVGSSNLSPTGAAVPTTGQIWPRGNRQ